MIALLKTLGNGLLYLVLSPFILSAFAIFMVYTFIVTIVYTIYRPFKYFGRIHDKNVKTVNEKKLAVYGEDDANVQFGAANQPFIPQNNLPPSQQPIYPQGYNYPGYVPPQQGYVPPTNQPFPPQSNLPPYMNITPPNNPQTPNQNSNPNNPWGYTNNDNNNNGGKK